MGTFVKFLMAMAIFACHLAWAGGSTSFTPPTQRIGDDPVPWPWGLEVPFPFEVVTGVWHAKLDGNDFYFIMTPVIREPSSLQLMIRQISLDNCSVISSGVASVQGKVAYAHMSSTVGTSYWIALRAFYAHSLPPSMPMKPIQGKYVALTVSASDFSKEVTLPIQLLSAQIPSTCR